MYTKSVIIQKERKKERKKDRKKERNSVNIEKDQIKKKD